MRPFTLYVWYHSILLPCNVGPLRFIIHPQTHTSVRSLLGTRTSTHLLFQLCQGQEQSFGSAVIGHICPEAKQTMSELMRFEVDDDYLQLLPAYRTMSDVTKPPREKQSHLCAALPCEQGPNMTSHAHAMRAMRRRQRSQ